MTEVKSFTSTNKFRLEKIPAYNTPVRQEVKKTRKGVFYFFEEEARIRAQGSHGAIAKKGYH